MNTNSVYIRLDRATVEDIANPFGGDIGVRHGHELHTACIDAISEALNSDKGVVLEGELVIDDRDYYVTTYTIGERDLLNALDALPGTIDDDGLERKGLVAIHITPLPNPPSDDAGAARE